MSNTASNSRIEHLRVVRNQARAQLARDSRYKKNKEAIRQSREAFEQAQYMLRVEELVASAPPLSDETRQYLATVLSGGAR